MSTTTSNLGLFKYDTTNPTDLASAFNINTALNNNWDIIDEALAGGGSSRNIGEIVASIVPLTDAGLHLLDGSLIQGSGIYSAFVDYIASIYDATANYFCTEQEWQTAVTTYGVCGKFVYDSVNNTVRLPKVTGILEGTTDLTALGDLVEAGLPNITGSFNKAVNYINNGNDGCFAVSQNSGKWGGNEFNWYDLYFDASRSNSIYGNSSTVQPQTIKAFYYIVIATSTKTDIQVDIDEVVTDLNGKADTDLTNVTDTAKVMMSRAGMPSNTYTNLTLGATGTNYTAPSNGWFAIVNISTGSGQFLNVTNNSNLSVLTARATGSNNYMGVLMPVLKGTSIEVSYSAPQSNLFRFIYAQGSESEAN